MATFSRPKQNPENYPENGTSPQIALWRLTLYLKIKPASTLSYNGTQSVPPPTKGFLSSKLPNHSGGAKYFKRVKKK